MELRIGKKGEGAGWTVKNVISLIVSVLGIVLILFGIYAGVKYFFVNQETQNAETLIDDLYGKINLLEDGQNNTFLVRGVEGWYIAGFSKSTNPDSKPEECFFDSCLCLCNGGADGNTCGSSGICKIINKDSVEAKISGFRIIEEQALAVDELVCIPLSSSKLVSLQIVKNTNEVEIIASNLDLPKGTNLAGCIIK